MCIVSGGRIPYTGQGWSMAISSWVVMEVMIKLHYVLKAYAPGKDYREPFTLSVADGAVLGQALAALGVPSDREYLFFIGSERVTRDRALKNGDTVTILPPIVGG